MFASGEPAFKSLGAIMNRPAITCGEGPPIMKVTIGIPVLNCQEWIGQAIESALNQTWPDKEVIVVDNGSTDDTPTICRSFGDRIRYFLEERRGLAPARNRIVWEATGDWILCLDADDSLMPEKLEAQLSSGINFEDVDVIMGSCVTEVWQGGSVQSRSHCTMPRALFHASTSNHSHEGSDDRSLGDYFGLKNAKELVDLWISFGFPQTAGCIWKRETLVRLGGWDDSLRTGEDVEIYLRALQANLCFYVDDTVLVAWRIWSDGTLSREHRNEMVLVWGELINRFETWLKSEGRWTEHLRQAAERKRFWVAREVAKTDIELATKYYEKQKTAGYMLVDETIAPWRYQVVLRILGFKRAEQFARLLRALPLKRARRIGGSIAHACTVANLVFLLTLSGTFADTDLILAP
jgi:glycosyltransferase involved in cell wall biosynthesis